jgi:predicted RecB family nuclease
MTIPHLSKSRFLAGLQCPLRLWYACYEPELASETTPAQQAIFDTGHVVGELARDRYPGGKLIDEDRNKLTEAMLSTEEAVKSSSIPSIYEATFAYDDVLIRADILERAGDDAWNLIEVKSGTKVKDDNLEDVAIQHYVLKGFGFEIGQAGILNLNNEYVYDGRQLDLKALFKFEDLRGQVAEMQEQIAAQVQDLKAMLGRAEPPKVIPSKHCKNPHGCEFFDHCRKSMPEHWVVELWKIGKEQLDELAEMEISDIRDIPDSFHLKAIQARIRDCVINNREFVGADLGPSLGEYEYPIHFLDFETINPAIPRYANTSPYQVLPFQWSDHILSKNGTLDHKKYLCGDDKDPREELTESLLEALGDKGSICTYGPYEKTVISGLVNYLPRHRARLKALVPRCKDLLSRIRRGYYHPNFNGGFSLKNVLPVLVPSMSYEDLSIQEGSMAGIEYLKMIDPKTPSDEKERIRKDLLKYCERDTRAMVEIREELLKRCR